MKNLTTVLALSLALCLPLHAQETATSITQLQEKAEAGDAEAQYQLGKAYETGEGVSKYLSTARYWYEKAALQKNIAAQERLKKIYCHDYDNITIDSALEKLLEDAADKQDSEAICALDKINPNYDDPKNKENTLGRLKKSAMRGNPKSQYELGNRHASIGGGVAYDKAEAVKWWLAAAKQGHIDAARKMGDAYRDGFGIAPDQKQADYWYEQFFAHSDNLNAYAEIGVAYSSAETPDYARAQYWWQRGAKQGNIASRYYLAWLDYWGKNGKRDLTTAEKTFTDTLHYCQTQADDAYGICPNAAYYLALLAYPNDAPNIAVAKKYLKKALEICDRNMDDYLQPTHCNDAAYRLALITETETGGDEKQRAAARQYWQKAATWGNPDALRQLKLRAWAGDSESAAYLAQRDAGEDEKKAWLTIAAHMEEGDIDWEMAQDITIDNDEKYIWLARAINAGHPEARKEALEYDEKAFHLGEIFAQGMGVPADPAQANYWLTQAVAQKGNNRAFRQLQQNAQQGDANAQYHLATLYYSGMGIPTRSTWEAKYWLEKAAEQGNIEAQYHLALIYEEIGESKSAEKWMTQAAGQGNLWAAAWLKQHETRN